MESNELKWKKAATEMEKYVPNASQSASIVNDKKILDAAQQKVKEEHDDAFILFSKSLTLWWRRRESNRYP